MTVFGVINSPFVVTMMSVMGVSAVTVTITLLKLFARFVQVEGRVTQLTKDLDKLATNQDLIRWWLLQMMRRQGIKPRRPGEGRT